MCIKSELEKVGGRPLTQQKLQFAQIMINGLSAAPASQCRSASAEVQSQARSGRALIPDNLNCHPQRDAFGLLKKV